MDTRPSAPSARAEIDHGVPVFLDQLVAELRLGLSSSVEITTTATQHGQDLLRAGFTVSQVVHDYGDVCQAITEMSVERDAPISADDFRMLNHCLDDAIAGAVTEYGRERDEPDDGGAAGDSERFKHLARELEKSIDTAIVALQVIKSARVGIAGSTGTVLQGSLLNARDHLDQLVVEVSTGR